MNVLTVGHSNHDIDAFLRLLEAHEVTAIADVRSVPSSRFHPQFNRDPLGRDLAKNGIHYVFLGKELGARSNDPSCYVDGQVQYGRLAATDSFKAGIDRIIAGSNSQTIALMCAEKEPLDCHRTVLVAESLRNRGVLVGHIHSDGALEGHAQALQRLRTKWGLGSPDLLRTEEELVREALGRQEKEIAYVDQRLLAVEGAGR